MKKIATIRDRDLGSQPIGRLDFDGLLSISATPASVGQIAAPHTGAFVFAPTRDVFLRIATDPVALNGAGGIPVAGGSHVHLVVRAGDVISAVPAGAFDAVLRIAPFSEVI